MINSLCSCLPCFKQNLNQSSKKSKTNRTQKNQTQQSKNASKLQKQTNKQGLTDRNLNGPPPTNMFYSQSEALKLQQREDQPYNESYINDQFVLKTPSTCKSDYILNDVDRPLDCKAVIAEGIENKGVWDIYEKIECVGQGSFAKVYKVNKINSKSIFALKIYKPVQGQSANWKLMELVKKEISILQDLRKNNSKHCIQLIDFMIDVNLNEFYLVLEYLQMNLHQFLKENPNLENLEKKKIVHQIISGVAQIHNIGVMHRDLKPQNIMINEFSMVKIADFGLGQYYKDTEGKTFDLAVGTLWYRAPQILLGVKNYLYQIDLWSLGLICAEVYLQKPLIKGYCAVDQLFKIFNLFGLPSNFKCIPSYSNAQYLIDFPPFENQGLLNIALKSLSFQQIQIVSSLLQVDPSMRTNCIQILQNTQYFKNFMDD